MPRGHYHPSSCRVCGRHRNEVGTISQAGLCTDDAKRHVRDNIEQMVTFDGPNFAKWRRSMAASVGAVFLDAETNEAHTGDHAS